MNKIYDLAIIGGGPGGYVSAIRASQLGLSVVLIEQESLGGICLNWGCIPTKAMIKSAEVFQTLKKANEFGLSASNIEFDLNVIVSRSKKIAEKLSNGVKHLLKKNKITVLSGKASIQSPDCIRVVGADITDVLTKNIIIATGARAREIKGFESDGNLIWNYKNALRPKKLPKNLLVVGSGAIGAEFASFYNALGTNVTIIEMLSKILPQEDHEISKFAKSEFGNRGINVKVNTSILKLEKKKNKLEIRFDDPSDKKLYEFDTVIMATGIVGNIEEVGIDKLGIEVEKGHVLTDPFCRTNIPNIYAIGDVAGAPWLAHKASHEGVQVAELIAGIKVRPIESSRIPGCTFSFPQIASVGFTEDRARELGYKLKVGKFPFVGNGKALAIGEAEGFIKTIFDEETGELLGAHMIGSEVTELIHSFVLGQQLETTEEDLIEAIFPHPTLSEMLHESTLNAFGRGIHF
jgi:dihydrolipoamide dehydrogenase